MNEETQKFRKMLNESNLSEEDKAEIFSFVESVEGDAKEKYNEYIKEVEEERRRRGLDENHTQIN